MKNLLTKKNVLWMSGVGGGIFLLFLFALLYDFCGPYRQICKDIYTPAAYLFFSFPFVFFLSLVTLKMPNDVFRHWMNFTVWAVPVLIVLTYLLTAGSNNGLGIESAYGGSFDTLLLVLLYGIFLGISLYRIVNKNKQLKRGN
jgi:cytochrome bd-type quinol oxidase subunit 2